LCFTIWWVSATSSSSGLPAIFEPNRYVHDKT
jgi:hypothetical protein